MNEEYQTPTTDDSEAEEMFVGLGRFTTGTIPVDTVVKRGRLLRYRRRGAVTGVAAAAAALTITVPVALAGGGGTEYAASSTGKRVTVNPTNFANGKGHFSGTVDGKKWSVDYDNKNCIGLSMSCGFPGPYPWDLYSLTGSTDWGQSPDEYALFLRPGATRVEVQLQDGERLDMEAVPVINGPVVLFNLPFGLGVSRIDVFDAHGNLLAFSMPFTLKGATSSAGQWYKPGATVPTVTGSTELASADMGKFGKLVITAYIGSAGPCTSYYQAGHPSVKCGPSSPLAGSLKFTSPMQEGSSSSGLADPKMDHFQLDYTDGTKSAITFPKRLGPYSFFAYIVPPGKEAAGLTAFDAAGEVLPVLPPKPFTYATADN